MKKKSFNPGFEFIFAIGILTMLILPPMVMAQEHREIKVMINNGDTIINGKNIKDLSPAEHKDALREIADLNKEVAARANGNKRRVYKEVRDINTLGDFREHSANHDSTDRKRRFHGGEMFKNGENMPHGMDGRNNGGHNGEGQREFGFNREGGRGSFMQNRRNTQNFSYSNTNNDGISTRVNFSVSDANKGNRKRTNDTEKPNLTIIDLNIAPQFSTGKTMLSFTLAEKGSAEVQFKDSEGKILWSDKTPGSFYKNFELPQNGIYYLQVKQNGKVGLRRIVKEQ
jgi:hypothetical protein